MGFAKRILPGAIFGIPGAAANFLLTKKKHKDNNDKPEPSLMNSSTAPAPSLISKPTVY